MTLSNTDASVTLTFRVREQVTQALARMQSGLTRVGETAANTGKFLGQNALQMVAVGSAMVAGAGAAAQLAVKFGILSEAQGKTASSFIQGAGAVVAMVGGLSQLGVFITSSGLIGLLGSAGGAIGVIGAAAVAAAAGIAVLTTALQVLSGQQSTLEQLTGASFGGGNRFQRIGNLLTQANPVGAGAAGFGDRQGIGTQAVQRGINVSINTFAATESELRQAAKTLGRILQEEARIGGFSLSGQ
jgi:hypothetical protein